MGRGGSRGSPGLGPSLGRTSPGSRGGGAGPWKEEAGKDRRADLVRDAEDPHGPARAPSASSSRRRRRRLHRGHGAAQAAAAAAAAGRARPRLPGGGRAGARSAPWRPSWAGLRGACRAGGPRLAPSAPPWRPERPRRPPPRALLPRPRKPAALCSPVWRLWGGGQGGGGRFLPRLKRQLGPWRRGASHPPAHHNASAGANSSRLRLHTPKSATDLGKEGRGDPGIVYGNSPREKEDAYLHWR